MPTKSNLGLAGNGCSEGSPGIAIFAERPRSRLEPFPACCNPADGIASGPLIGEFAGWSSPPLGCFATVLESRTVYGLGEAIQMAFKRRAKGV